ncbi:MAG: isoprenylcysteine carboxylmethyltransferase family protein [Chthoniobacteraceae bacterium]
MKPPDWLARGSPWVWAQNFLTLAVLALGPVLRSQQSHRPGIVAGALLLGAGALFGVAGVRALGRNRTPFPKPREDARLVEHGIFSIVRHPLYTSLCLISIGWALLWWSGPALVAALALAMLLDAKARLEESWLRELFPNYDAYARRVRRLIPGVY